MNQLDAGETSRTLWSFCLYNSLMDLLLMRQSLRPGLKLLRWSLLISATFFSSFFYYWWDKMMRSSCQLFHLLMWMAPSHANFFLSHRPRSVRLVRKNFAGWSKVPTGKRGNYKELLPAPTQVFFLPKNLHMVQWGPMFFRLSDNVSASFAMHQLSEGI